MPAPIADAPPTIVQPFHGPTDTVVTMIRMVRGPRGANGPLVRSLKEHIIRDLQPKDYFSELLAVRNYAAEKIRYANDALTQEQVQDPERIAEQIVSHGRAVGDCDDIALFIAALDLALGRQAEFVTVGFAAPGHFSHVFTRGYEPKSKQWIVQDPVAGTDEAGMLRRVTTYKTWRID